MRIRLKSESSPERTPARIVVIHDSPSILEMFEVVIRGSLKGATVASFLNSTEAWAQLPRLNPSLLIINFVMPVLSGKEICQRLLAEGVDYPIIVTSAWDKAEEWVKEVAERGLKVFWLPLPFLIPDFQKVLKNALAASDASRDKPGSGNPKFKFFDHLMKSSLKMFVAGAVCGLLISLWMPVRPRYEIRSSQSLAERGGYMVLLDTWTGKTWAYGNGTWQPINEAR